MSSLMTEPSAGLSADTVRLVTEAILNDVDPDHLVDYLFQERTISEDEMQILEKTVTRKEKCRVLVSQLNQFPNPHRNFQVLIKALDTQGYDFLTSAVKSILDANKARVPCAADPQLTKATTEKTLKTKSIPDTDSSTPSDNVISRDEMVPLAWECLSQKKSKIAVDLSNDTETVSSEGETSASSKNVTSNSDLSTASFGLTEIFKGDASSSPSSRIPQSNTTKITLASGNDNIYLGILPPAGGGLGSSKKVRHMFDRLSTMLNSGNTSAFTSMCNCILGKTSVNKDLLCVVKYLQACRHCFNDKYSVALSCLREAEIIAKQTTSPVQYGAYLLSCQCWIHMKSRKFEQLLVCLVIGEETISAYPVLCQGMASGWIYLNKAQYMLPLMASRPSERTTRLIQNVVMLLDRALEQFQLEKSRDGPCGCACVFIVKATTLLRCGSMMNTVRLPVSEEDLLTAGNLLDQADASVIGLPEVLKPSYYTAMADLNFRRRKFARAEEYAHQALDASVSLNLPDAAKRAKARLRYLGLRIDRCVEQHYILDTCHTK